MERNWHPLQVVSTDSLRPLSRVTESSVHRLTSEISTDGRQRNPIAVARLDSGERIILDGVSRWRAFNQLGIGDILAQTVELDDPNLELSSWRHLVSHLTAVELERMLQRLCLSFEKFDSDFFCQEVHSPADGILVVLSDRSAYRVLIDRADLSKFNRQLSDFVMGYSTNSQVVRLHAEHHTAEVIADSGTEQACIHLPTYTCDEVLEITASGDLLPPYLACYSFPHRYLDVGLSLKILSAKTSIDDKNAFLDDLIRMRLSRSRAAFYPQSVFLMGD